MDEFTAPALKHVVAKKPLPCPFTAQGMLQPSHAQPPPMFGPRGATIPPRHIHSYKPRQSFGQQGRPDSGQAPRFQARTNPFQRQRFPHKIPDFHEQYNRDQRRNVGSSNNSASSRSKELFCETCDRDFRTPDQLAEHRQQHQRCGIDGCQFEAHEAMVSKHIQQQHSSGLYDKLKNLTTPEEIAKWREERRKRFPTKQNMELRQQIQEAKQKRGERLEDSKSRFGQKGDRRNGSVPGQRQTGESGRDPNAETTQNKKKRRKRKPAGNFEKKGKVEEMNVDSVVAVKEQVVNGALVMFGGTEMMKNYKRPRVVKQNALSGLLGDYGSDESVSEDEVSEEDVLEVVTALPVVESQKTTPEDMIVQLESEISYTDGRHMNVNAIRQQETTKLPFHHDALNQSKDISHSEELETVPYLPTQEIDTLDFQPTAVDENYDVTIRFDPNDQKTSEVLNDDEGPPEETTVQRVSDFPYPDDQEISAKPQQKPKKRHHKQEVPAASIKKPKPTSILDLSRRYRNQNTMLEKLLQKDIRHERNVLLQCVRYVVDKKFFGIGQLKAGDDEEHETTAL